MKNHRVLAKSGTITIQELPYQTLELAQFESGQLFRVRPVSQSYDVTLQLGQISIDSFNRANNLDLAMVHAIRNSIDLSNLISTNS